MAQEKQTQRNCGELGYSLRNIFTRLLANQNLLKLLYYADKDPLGHEDLTTQQINKEIYEKLIKVRPVVGPKETAHSVIGVKINQATTSSSNSEFRDVSFTVEVFVPITQWEIKDNNLRPFAILGEIQRSLNEKDINGLGKIRGGSFILNYTSEEISAYEQYFHFVNYD